MSIFLPPYQNGSDDLLLQGMFLFFEMDDDERSSGATENSELGFTHFRG